MQKQALLVGLNKYQLLGELRYARQDSEEFGEALRMYCGFSDQDITLMSCRSEGALLGDTHYIELALGRLVEHRDLDLLVFGFWGHGFSPEPGKRYLCGINTIEEDLLRSAISLDMVKAKLAQVQAENTLLILDCCQNRPTGRSLGGESMTKGEETALASLARDIQAVQRNKDWSRIPTVAVLTSCREGQKAYEWESRGHGIFTEFLLQAFKETEGSIGAIASWMADRVAKTAAEIFHQNQVPYLTFEGKGDFQLALKKPPLEQKKKLSLLTKDANEIPEQLANHKHSSNLGSALLKAQILRNQRLKKGISLKYKK